MLPTNPLLNATAPAGPHLPVALLRQYAAGTLAPAAQHRVEAHTLACPRCADILEGLLQSPPATTDQALAQLQQRLRMRVQQQAAPARLAPARPPRWLAPQLAAAATLLLGLVAGGWWTWQQRHPTPSAGPEPVTIAISPPTPPAEPAAATKPAAPARAAAPRAAASRAQPQPARPTPPLAARLRHSPARQAPRPVSAKEAETVVATTPVPAATETEAPPAAPALAPAAGVALSALATNGDTAGFAAKGLPGQLAKARATPEAARVRNSAMPAGPAIAPAPAGGYAALREKLRREAAEFVPEAPERPLSGTVQLRVTIGADGKLQEIKVLRGLRADYDEEAQRLVCEGPAWVPGISGGRRAAQTIDLAVPF